MALFLAVLGGPRLGKEIPGIPKLSPEEARRRNVLLSIQSDHRAVYLRKFGDVLAGCQGQAVENDLWVYVRKDNCPGLGPQRFGRIGQLEGALLTKIECDEVQPTSIARCETRFPFEGFSVRVNFDRDLLPRWREMIGFSKTFLKSKQYQPI